MENKYMKKTINYDTEMDVLYINFSNISNSIGYEDIDNIVYLKDLETQEVTGITILNFKSLIKINSIDIKNLTHEFSLEKDLKRYIN